MKKSIIIQARMTSTRLPGKVLKEVGGKPMLAQQINRLRMCKMIDEIVIATTTNVTDEPVVELATRESVAYFCGSEQDVLGRFLGAAQQTKADVIIRSTADCPLIDPEVTDLVIKELIDHTDECDYASNIQPRTYPRGLDVEAFFYDTLLRMNRLGKSVAAREHVTIVSRSERPELFLCRSVEDTRDNSDLRLTVDTEADLQLIRKLYDALMLSTRVASYREIVSYLRARPELLRINEGIETWSPT
jgi:spore coat polysaccharide biosynthesis protein SpsF